MACKRPVAPDHSCRIECARGPNEAWSPVARQHGEVYLEEPALQTDTGFTRLLNRPDRSVRASCGYSGVCLHHAEQPLALLSRGRLFRLCSWLLAEFVRDHACKHLEQGNKSSTNRPGVFISHKLDRLLFLT